MDMREHLTRSSAINAGHITVTVSAELGRLLVANRGNRRKAVAAGIAELATRKTLQAKEATELAAIMEMFFDSPDGQDPKLAQRASAYFHKLTLDSGSSVAALAIASVISSLTSAPKAAGGGGQQKAAAPRASAGGDALFGGVGAVIGAGIGFGFGGPIGAGIGAAVGGAVGVCINES